jgi:hypothetical protein
MASTEALLNLAISFPEAFADPESASIGRTVSQGRQHAQNERIQALLDLAAEFPEAFADPEAAVVTTITPPETAEPEVQPSEEQSTPTVAKATLPDGYECALSRTISTFTWGNIEAHLRYSATGLVLLWLVVGKSGTEVQSLCEAICRLTNLLLAHQVPISEIVQQLRGIRGADSEGLGPHRILGLADAVGKILQEAPATLASSTVTPVQAVATTPVQEVIEPESVDHASDSQNGKSAVKADSVALSNSLLELSDNNHRMSLCPECGSELQAMNGCSGGACQVCGYSSCS